jgi:hypothetical protein
LMMMAICSSKTSVLTWATRRNIPENDIQGKWSWNNLYYSCVVHLC